MMRELLYVDVARVRSLLSQLDGGIVESAVERTVQQTSSQVGAAVLGLGAHRSGESVTEAEESRTLQDLLFAVFDEVGASQGLIRDVDPDYFSDSEAWESSQVHAGLTEGEIIRIFLPVLITDPIFVRGRLNRMLEMAGAFRTLQEDQIEEQLAALEANGKREIESALADVSASRDKKATVRKAKERELKTVLDNARATATAASAFSTDEFTSMLPLIDSFLSTDAISVRFLGCGDSNPKYSMVGSLLGRDEYIQREREALFARYGSLLEGWTAVVQIATVPSRSQLDAARSSTFDDLDFTSGDGIDRAAIEQVVMRLLGRMEIVGISEGPVWPSVSVVPLAIFRTVPRSSAAPDPDLDQ